MHSKQHRKIHLFQCGSTNVSDSFQFMASSLAKLVDATDNNDFKITQNSFNPQPIETRLYGSFSSEDGRPIILRGCVDKRKLAYIFEHSNQFDVGSSFQDGQNTDKETQLSLLRIYLFMVNHNEERLMSYSQRHGFRRYWTAEKLGTQNMSREIRHTICKDSLFDIDMKNRQQTLLSCYCHKHMINCGALDEYIKRREPMLQDLMNNRCITRDESIKNFA